MVDDDAGYAEGVADALRKRYPALKVDVAQYGTEAIKKVRENDCPSLILADYKMPVMDGRELGRILKQSYGKRVKVLLMSAQPMVASIAEDIDGMFIDGTIEKPVNLNKLYAAVESWFHSGRSALLEEKMILFHGRLKAARGKQGILIPRQTITRGEIDPNEEYEVYMKKSTHNKKINRK